MKVGGMGIQFINKKGVNVDSFLYTNVVGWKYSRSDETLHIELGQTKADGREANIEKEIGIKTPDGEEIGLLMREHAQKVAKTIKLEKKEKAAAEEKRLQEAVGTYRIENPVTCREGAAFDSAQTVQLEIGDVIEVTEAAIATQKEPDDTTRLKCEKGWLSLKPHLCVKLDADGAPQPLQPPPPPPLVPAGPRCSCYRPSPAPARPWALSARGLAQATRSSLKGRRRSSSRRWTA